jgi:phosphoribosyl 1,2-cyclic phosphate phosphodiesterase
MRLTLLGCGTSSGVPRIGNEWGACDPADPRNRRTRAAITVEADGTTILVDTGPDMRAQLLAAGIGWLDAVIWTHEHADHTHGVDDLRQIFHLRGSPVPGYARPETLEVLSTRFRYVFSGRHGYPPTAELSVLPDISQIGSMTIKALDQPHGRISSTGLRFEQDGRSVGYATDCSRITPKMKQFFAGVDLWVVDALRREPHPTHCHLAEVLEAVPTVGASRTILTHMDHSMDYQQLADELPPGVEPGVDGLVVDL